MPMHLQISPTGHILHAGPTVQKLRPEGGLVGARLLEVFHLRSPRSVQTMDDLRDCVGKRLKLQFREAPKTGLKGALVMSDGDGVMVLNLSFGISLVEAIREYDLHAADFAATDLSVELLYLMEAKSAAMNESHKLNRHLQAAKIAAEEQAFTDTLTGLKNRRALSHIMDRLLTEQRAFGLMQLDLDFFKLVNDQLGHSAGDHVLQRTAAIMVEHTRQDTVLVRIGGDEFVLLFPDLRDARQLLMIAERLIAALEEPIPFGSVNCEISASIGASVVQAGCFEQASDLLEQVDQALYASKRAGRGCATLYEADKFSGDPATIELRSHEMRRVRPGYSAAAETDMQSKSSSA
ncbi:MAG: GGDEF domain-containing protein [Mangrovicoccus sp.]|nr:GGDEF domain-containing protein [Mangrovicoccus sp.]